MPSHLWTHCDSSLPWMPQHPAAKEGFQKHQESTLPFSRFSAPSAVGQCAVKNVHKGSLTLTWSVNYLGFLLQMLVLGFGSIWEGFKGCKKKLNPLFSKTAKWWIDFQPNCLESGSGKVSLRRWVWGCLLLYFNHQVMIIIIVKLMMILWGARELFILNVCFLSYCAPLRNFLGPSFSERKILKGGNTILNLHREWTQGTYS